jgi:hypothetical protein
MRFMAMIKATKDYEAGKPPNPELMAAMGRLSEEMQKLGKFEMGGGLLPSAQGHRLSLSGGKVSVTDGPFAETHEQLGGYFLIEAKNLDEATSIAARIPSAQTGTIEVRPLVETAAEASA